MSNRVTQVSGQVISAPTSGNARVTQLGFVTLIDTEPPVRITQLAFEVIRDNVPDATPATGRAYFVG